MTLPFSPRRNQLPVIQKLVAVYKLWHEIIPHLPKSARFTLGEKIDLCLLEVAESLFSASYATPGNRLPLVRTAGSKLDLAKFLLYIAWEVKGIDNKKYIALSQKLDETGRMIGGWVKQLSLKETPSAPQEGE